jgi:hypothetical protein
MANFRFGMNLVQNTGKSNSLEVGSIMHTILEHYYKAKIQGFTNSQAISMSMAMGETMIKGCPVCTGSTDDKPLCGHKPNEFPGLQNTPMESSTKPNRVGWKHVLTTAEQYFEFYRNDSWVPLEVEIVKGEVLYEDDEIRVLWKAKLDLVADTNQSILPIDHKTMSQRRDTVSMNNQFMGQCIIMKTRNVVINKIGWQTSLEPREKFIRTILSYSSDRLLEWQSEILPFYAYQLLTFVESEYYPPRFDHCEGKYGPCPYLEVCEANRDMRQDIINQNFIITDEWNPTNE